MLNQSAGNPDLEVVRIEDSFNSLLTKVGTLVNRSVVLVSHFHHELDQALRTAFSPEVDREREVMLKTSDEDLDSDFLEGVGLDDVLESFFDFGRTVMEEFGVVITQVFSDLHVEEKKANEGVLSCRALLSVYRASSVVPVVNYLYFVFFREETLPQISAKQETVPRSAQTVVSVLAAAGKVRVLSGSRVQW